MKVIDLRPDSKLLVPNFDSYKLSLDPTPILKNENILKPRKIKLDSNQYSLHHTTLFQLQNHLVPDPWLSYTCYYITNDNTVEKISYDINTGRLKETTPVFKFSPNRELIEGIYNAELKFISEKYAVLSDGTGNLTLIETGDRQKGDEWKKVENFQPLSDEETSFILQDAKFKIEKGEKVIHCILLHIKQIDEKFNNVINWISIKEEGNTKKWSVADRRTIQGRGSLFYLSLDVHCQAIVYSSNHEFKYTFDSVNEVIEEIPREDLKNVQNEPTVYKFQWSQKEEDITINFNIIPGATKDDYSVKCHQSNIEVKCLDEVLISSDTFAEIDTELTTWSLENDFLQLNLIKKQPELIWPYLIPSGPLESTGGDKNSQPFNAQPVSDLNSQIEECDFGDNGQDNNEYFIERLECVSHRATHKIFLSCNHPLFAITLRPGFPKALAIRNDVDCCLWLQSQLQPNDDWSLKHEGTLHAFGYVQASKRDRKYLSTSPDLSVAVISESIRHLFIYKKSYSTAGGLRKRSGPQLQIGQQKLVALDGTHGEILGIHVENDVVLLLTENSILCLQIGDEN